MTKKEFKFIEITGDTIGINKDYWYETSTEVNQYLVDKYVENKDASVPIVVYAKTDNDIAIVIDIDDKRTIVMSDDEELLAILKELSEEAIDE